MSEQIKTSENAHEFKGGTVFSTVINHIKVVKKHFIFFQYWCTVSAPDDGLDSLEVCSATHGHFLQPTRELDLGLNSNQFPRRVTILCGLHFFHRCRDFGSNSWNSRGGAGCEGESSGGSDGRVDSAKSSRNEGGDTEGGDKGEGEWEEREGGIEMRPRLGGQRREKERETEGGGKGKGESVMRRIISKIIIGIT